MFVQTIILAVCATLAAAAPSLESRSNSGNAFHYGIAGPVVRLCPLLVVCTSLTFSYQQTACPGVSLPANGLYAAVQTVGTHYATAEQTSVGEILTLKGFVLLG